MGSSNAGKIVVANRGSGMISVLDALSSHSPVPTYLGEATVGLNPFGLAYAP